ncbi:single-stranded-DNA-specific exonuclease RecJ [Candidatus Contubernalis alkaliaceticus]|uniref:single-stranded-DNA-specific exonuclease RecJ n=1 Tax=Candidatus Contubernalis alkaliaceticus TaxID=338645 RepID=UPI001F4C157B|nr:single-stranded-DNA-specific exonuclease RecJ [Candidatus Contubernalis alkalaceticus]UNC92892.1 single-stranded-DNA-specific exonuclease RecJ [Candidatus Contubernalis alkalaceticus]
MHCFQYSWQLKEGDPALRDRLSAALKVKPVIAQLLINRGITDAVQGRRFLYPRLEDLNDPESLKGLISARDRLKEALDKGKNIVVYGDYDVDGITGTVILVTFLRKLGGSVSYYIPHRLTEGYGLNSAALDRLKEQGADVVVTVDCGISSLVEVEHAKKLGLEIIVTDHHTPLDSLPECVILNPKQAECGYPFKELAGVGVAFKLLQSFLPREQWEEYLDLVALGTIADIVCLLDENRVLTRYGMDQLNVSSRPGVQALKEACGFGGREISSGQISFSLAPRLNAAGRIGQTEKAVELLLTSSKDRAQELAALLNGFNQERQKIEGKILKEAVKEIEEKGVEGKKVIVLAREGWHSGVMGIVASRLVDNYGRPVVIISLEGEEGRGSARSVEGFNLIGAIQGCADLLIRYGGHQQAAGLTISHSCIQEFERQINHDAEKMLPSQVLGRKISLEAELEASQIDLELLDQLNLLSPFGQGNPLPYFKTSELEVESFHFVGKQKNHLKMKLKNGENLLEAIAFKMEDRELQLMGRKVSAAYLLEDNFWGELRTPVMQLKDLHFCDSTKAGGIMVIDRRGLDKKEKYLRALAEQKNCLVYINTLGQKKRLSQLLGKDRGCFYSHQGCINDQVLGNIENLIIYDLPLEEEKLSSLVKALSGAMGNVSLHLLYGQEDFKANRVFLQAILPQRNSLIRLFKAIKKVERQGNIQVKELITYLKNDKPFSYTDHLLKKSLDIFQEINLLEPIDQGSGNFRMLSSQEVGDLSQSQVYQDNLSLWKDLEAFQTFLLQEDKSTIVSFFVGSQVDDTLYSEVPLLKKVVQ